MRYYGKDFFSVLSDNKESFLKKITFFAPLVVIVCIAFIKSVYLQYYFWLMKEDGIIEYSTFFCYFAAFIVAFSIAKYLHKSKNILYSFLYIIFGLGLFYIAMEEINWGQRIFGIKTPEILKTINYQQEMNTHNIKCFPLHALYMIVGFYGAFIRLVLPKKLKDRYPADVNLVAPTYHLFFYFFPIFILYFYRDYITPIEMRLFGDHFIYQRFIHQKDQELAELFVSIGFLLFVLINKYKQQMGKLTSV